MSARWNTAGNIRPFATSAVSRVSAPYQTTGSGNTAKTIRKLIGMPQHSYVMQEAPRQYIRSVREAAISGSYRRGLERSGSRDELNRHHIESMHSLLGSLRETDPAEDGGFILVHLNSLMREHSRYLGSESFEKLDWAAKPLLAPAKAEEGAVAEPEEEAAAGEEARTVFTQLLEQSGPAEDEPAREPAATKPAEPAKPPEPPPAAQENAVASLGLK